MQSLLTLPTGRVARWVIVVAWVAGIFLTLALNLPGKFADTAVAAGIFLIAISRDAAGRHTAAGRSCYSAFDMAANTAAMAPRVRRPPVTRPGRRGRGGGRWPAGRARRSGGR